MLAAPLLSQCQKIPPKWDIFNTSLVALGIVLAIVSPALFFGQDLKVESSQLYILISAACYAASMLITKDQLKEVPAGIFTVFKFSIGTIAFHLIAVARGRDKWLTLIDSELWLHMLYYGIFFVTVPQQFFLKALKLCTRAVLAAGVSFGMPMQIVLFMLIFQTLPSVPVAIGSGFILVSIVSAIVKENVNGKMENEGGGGGLLNISDDDDDDATGAVDVNYQELNDDEF